MCVGSCARVQCVDFPLQGVGLENPSRAIAFPAIFHTAKFPHGGFSGEKRGKIIAGIPVRVAVDAEEVFGGQFDCSCHFRFWFVC